MYTCICMYIYVCIYVHVRAYGLAFWGVDIQVLDKVTGKLTL
jgi:hypothetical protein